MDDTCYYDLYIDGMAEAAEDTYNSSIDED